MGRNSSSTGYFHGTSSFRIFFDTCACQVVHSGGGKTHISANNWTLCGRAFVKEQRQYASSCKCPSALPASTIRATGTHGTFRGYRTAATESCCATTSSLFIEDDYTDPETTDIFPPAQTVCGPYAGRCDSCQGEIVRGSAKSTVDRGAKTTSTIQAIIDFPRDEGLSRGRGSIQTVSPLCADGRVPLTLGI